MNPITYKLRARQGSADDLTSHLDQKERSVWCLPTPHGFAQRCTGRDGLERTTIKIWRLRNHGFPEDEKRNLRYARDHDPLDTSLLVSYRCAVNQPLMDTIGSAISDRNDDRTSGIALRLLRSNRRVSWSAFRPSFPARMWNCGHCVID